MTERRLTYRPYLIRHEVIALHSKTEVYPVCIQVEVESSGSQTPEGVKFPAIYTEYSQDYLNTSWLNDPSQLASTLASFIPPGPPVHGGNGIAKPGAGTQPIEHKGAGSGNTTSLQGAPPEGTPAASAQGTTPVISPPVASPVTSPVVSPGLVGAADKAEVSPGDKPLAPSGGPKAGSLGSNKAVVLPDPAAPAPVSPGATADQDAASNISGGNCIFGHYQCLGTEMQVCQNLAESKIGTSFFAWENPILIKQAGYPTIAALGDVRSKRMVFTESASYEFRRWLGAEGAMSVGICTITSYMP